MTNLRLQTQEDSLAQIAELFLGSPSTLNSSTRRLDLEVREDRCFAPDKYLSVGEILLQPAQGAGPEAHFQNILSAVRNGFYEWRIPTAEDLFSSTKQILLRDNRSRDRAGSEQQASKSGADDNAIRTALKAIPHILVRTGLAHPVLDPGEVADMPFRRPRTIVADTSAVLQGALDFVLRFLHPQARIKIPAIVHMEIVLFVERYFSRRHKAQSNPARTLLDHVKSQGGQRVLIRLELQAPVEVERPRLGADPLRGIVQPDSDAEDKALGLSSIQRSFADRLILETAIQQRERVGPGHPIALLTCDQGLARMALAEGVQPIFFESLDGDNYLGKTYASSCYLPFRGGSNALYSVPLPSLIWELAATFGEVRLRNPHSGAFCSVVAMREDANWYPFHSRNDLLWVQSELGAGHERASGSPIGSSKPSDSSSLQRSSVKEDPREKLVGSYEVWPSRILRLLARLIDGRALTDAEAMDMFSIKTERGYRDYRNFLYAGGLVDRKGSTLYSNEETNVLWAALRTRDYDRLRQLLMRVPSFNDFVMALGHRSPLSNNMQAGVSQAAFPAYRAWGEMITIALEIPEVGVVYTPLNPPMKEFAKLAIEAFESLVGPDQYVLTGRWLETLARQSGIHPIRARERLSESWSAGLIERLVEGSTPENRYERHSMYLLDIVEGSPGVRQVNLYDGTFLIPGKASVRIRLEGGRS